MRPKKFEGENLYFSPLDMQDLPTFTRWVNDETLSRGLCNVSQSITELAEKAYLEKACSDVFRYQFSVIKKDNDKIIGTYDLHCVKMLHKNAEVGGFIGEIDERGKGYGTESLRMLCDFGFNVLGLNNLIGRVFSFNYASINSCEKVGFKKVGELKEVYFYNGKFHNELIYQISRDEFYKKWKTFVKPLPNNKK